MNLDSNLISLNPMQRKAVASPAKHLLVLAGAGSGKTRVLVSRIVHFVQQGEWPSKIMAVTFTNKAAKEMLERLANSLDNSVDALWVGTFHGLAYRILRQHAMAAGLPDSFQIIDSEDQKRIVKRIVVDLNLDEDEFEPKRVQAFINKQKDEGHRFKSMGEPKNRDQAVFFEVYRRYEGYCEQAGVVDFAEILLRTYELLRDNQELREYYQNKFSCVLVDEFQDTNTIQYLWLKKFCNSETNITVVGDDDQSIYGWRGAKIENIQKFSKDFPDTEVVRLEQNYRSTKNILEAANSLISCNKERLGKNLWTEDSHGEKISLYGAFNEIDEARFVVNEITKRALETGSYNDIAVLYRSNAQSRVLEQALRQQGINYQVYGGLRFFDRAEIKDVLAYLRLLVNKADDVAFERVINTPPRGIGERTVANIRQVAKEQEISLWQAVYGMLQQGVAGRSAQSLRTFVELIENLSALVEQEPIFVLAEELINKTNLISYLAEQTGEKAAAKVENLKEFIAATSQFFHNISDRGEDNLKILVEFLTESTLDVGDAKEDGKGVNLMTLHSAKGLEFATVFILGMEEGLFPHHRSAEMKEALEEERRLCYVGLTRARKKLYLSYAEKRSFSNKMGVNRPSRFINEISYEFMETVKLRNDGFNQDSSVNYYANSSNNYAKRSYANNSYNGGFSAPKTKVKVDAVVPFKLGQRVRHKKFGEGIVLDYEGSKESLRVKIRFDFSGEKWLVLAYARLEAC